MGLPELKSRTVSLNALPNGLGTFLDAISNALTGCGVSRYSDENNLTAMPNCSMSLLFLSQQALINKLFRNKERQKAAQYTGWNRVKVCKAKY